MGSFDPGFRPPITDGAEQQIERLRRGKKPTAWQRLRERGIVGISTTESGGLTSAPVASTGVKHDVLNDEKSLIPFGQGKKKPKPAKFKPDAIDGNSNGMVQDGTTQERPDTSKPKKIISSGKPKKPWVSAPSVGKHGGSGEPPKPPKPPKPWPPEDREKKKIKWKHPLLGEALLGRPTTTHYALRKKDGRYIRPRRELHRDIVNWFLGRAGKPKPEGERTIYFMGGGPSTGKTTALKSGVTGIPADVLKIDTDDIKEFIPEYREWVEWGIGSAASMTQDESKHITQLVSQALIENGGDFVYDTTGDGNYKGFAERLEGLRENGHRIVGHYMTNDLELALKLNEERFKQTGRKVPESNVSYIHQQVSRNIPQALRDGLFDELYLYDTNDLEKGPRLILSHKNGVTKIHDPKAYQKFLKKGEIPEPPPPKEGVAVTKPGGVWQPKLGFSDGKPKKPRSSDGADASSDTTVGPFDDPPVNPNLPAPYGPKKDKQ